MANFVTRIQNNIEECEKLLKPVYSKRTELLKEWSNGYFDNAPRTKRPVNLVSRAMKVLVPMLVSNNPKAMLRTRLLQLKPFAETLKLAINHLTEEIKLNEILREVVIDSLTCFGITKTGLAPGGDMVEDAYGYLHDAGQLFVERVDPTDYVFDVSAKNRETMDFEGNWYTVPRSYLTNSGEFQNFDKVRRYEFDKKEDTRKISHSALGSSRIETIRPYVRVCDVWLPSSGIIITIAEKGQGDKPLRIIEWAGPEEGPYDLLSYWNFPESIIPIPPLYDSIDLHYMINTMLRKMGRQANRNKKIVLYERSAEGDAEAVRKSADGEVIGVDNVDRLKEIEISNVNDQAYQWVEWLKNNWSEQSHNANLIGGLEAGADTLGQEQMLLANASAPLEDMINQVHNHARAIMRKLAFWIWTDPLIDIAVTKRAKGLEELEVHFDEEAKEGDFLQYNIDIEPYSMQRVSPMIRSRRIMELVTGVILPTADLAIQQGDILQISKLVKALAKDLDLTDAEIDDFYKSQFNPPMADLGPYPPKQGEVGGIGDRLGASEASKNLNSERHEAREGLKASPSQDKGGVK